MAGVSSLSAEQQCAVEPIHIPGSIQPHGYLLLVSQGDLRIEQLSANCAELDADAVIHWPGKSLASACPELALRFAHLAGAEPGAGAGRFTGWGREFDLLVHLSGLDWLLELEPVSAAEEDFTTVQRKLGIAVANLQRAVGVEQLCEVTAREVARLSGYDRVMIYRFHPDWHGEVVAEVRREGMDSFLGLHFPAADIPEQARRLYTRNWLRLIVRADYRSVRLVPPVHPRTGEYPDFTYSVLRSVSPVHLEYLRNMQVSGSMSVSLIQGDRLWGLIACHHRTPRHLPDRIRSACELIGRVASALLGAAEREAIHQARLAAKGAREAFLDQLAEQLDFAQALVDRSVDFLGLLQASSAVVVQQNSLRLIGAELPDHLIADCLSWVRAQAPAEFVSTEELGVAVPSMQDRSREFSGLFALPLTETRDDWFLWFRPEQARAVNWAGNPDKSLQDLALPIQPRKSFASWTQQVRGRSAPWTVLDQAAAFELRAAVNASIRRRTEHLLELNEELTRKNSDLNSFAFIASHDLRDPLRGIRNILEFISQDHGPELPGVVREDVEVAIRTADRMHEMLEGLLHFTRVSRKDLVAQRIEVREIIERALEVVRPVWQGLPVTVTVANDLPVARCDRVMMTEVFVNLLTNAVKYNLSAEKKIEVGSRSAKPGTVQITVSDNGIGIDSRHHDAIFTMFRRLHARGNFQGGVGVGLSVVKAIVERHGGSIAVESRENEGSTFVLTLEC